LLENHRQTTLFYQFLGSHSLLIGLLPFYLPVYLWGVGLNLAHITLLIGISGLSFCAALSAWQPLSRRLSLKRLMCITFILELLLVASTFFASEAWYAVASLGIANGLYNGFFWTTQRTLFLQLLGANDTGRRFGNFQIFVTVFLKIGILIGGWSLDAGGLPWLLMLSAVIGGLSSLWFLLKANSNSLHDHSSNGNATDDYASNDSAINDYESSATSEGGNPSIGLNQALAYKDKHHSRPVFIVDGFFLFLESHYWTLSLFMLAEENYAKFGVIVVLLALIFALLFFLIKNTIDTYAVGLVFRIAVLLYALSWVLRCFVSNELRSSILLLLLLVITFCSSFFRLAFNKRFFDIAAANNGVGYLLMKSYQSQFVLGCGFIFISFVLWLTGSTSLDALTPMYLAAAALSFVYLLYRLNTSANR